MVVLRRKSELFHDKVRLYLVKAVACVLCGKNEVAASASQNTHVFDKMGWGWWIKICRGEAPYLHHLLVKVEVLDFFVVPPIHLWTRIASFAVP